MKGRFGFSSLNIPIYTILVFSTVYLSRAHEQLCEETGNLFEGDFIKTREDERLSVDRSMARLPLPGEAEAGMCRGEDGPCSACGCDMAVTS